jgi:hypothetical protein
MSSVYHLSVCVPYNTANPIEQISETKGFRFVNLTHLINGDNSYENLRKLEWFRDFLSQNVSTHDAIILFTDAHDVLLMSDANDIVSRFLRTDCDLLISAEKMFSPWLPEEPAYRVAIKQFFDCGDETIAPYPNSGCWIGYGWAALEFLNVAVAYGQTQFGVSDQRVIQDIIARGECPSSVNLKLDVTQEIFVSVIDNGNNLVWIGNRIFFRDRSTPVPVFHANGYKKSLSLIKLYNEIIYKTSSKCVDIRAVKQGDFYLGFEDGRFCLSSFFCYNSLNALVKSNKTCCLFTNSGLVLSFEPNSSHCFASRALVDHWERIEVKRLNEALSRYIDHDADITLELHVLNNIWGYFSENIHTDIVQYLYNL